MSDLNIILNAILIPLIGLEGAAIASATSMMLTNLGGNVIMFKKMGYSAIYMPLIKSKK